jgi:single-stranded-DNA-specific exonuclease
VTDVVPLLGENRILVWSGLQVLNQGLRPGLRALAAVAGLGGCTLGSQELGFRLGPRLNAAGRLGDARRSLDLLLTRDPAEAERLAGELDRENARRQSLERTVLRAALARVAAAPEVPGALVLSDPEWPLGVLGLAASKLCERFHRPCFVLNEKHGVARGSGRSIPGFPLHSALESLSPLLAKWGGHELAAGVTLPAERVPEFARELAAAAERSLTPEQRVPELAIEAETPLQAITDGLVRELKRLEPFGFGNSRPLLAVTGVTLAAPPRVVGERHLKLRVTDTGRRVLDVIGFGLGERAPELRSGSVLDLAGFAGENEWNGARVLQLELKDFRTSPERGPA